MRPRSRCGVGGGCADCVYDGGTALRLRRSWVAAATAVAVFAPAAVALPAPSLHPVQVGSSQDGRPLSRPRTCHFALPAGQKTLYGVVMWKDSNRNGMFEDFQFMANGVSYTVITNFYDGRAPLTRVVNLACKQSPVQFVQVANFVYVTGAVGSAKAFGSTKKRPVIHARVVQVLTVKDRGA